MDFHLSLKHAIHFYPHSLESSGGLPVTISVSVYRLSQTLAVRGLRSRRALPSRPFVGGRTSSSLPPPPPSLNPTHHDHSDKQIAQCNYKHWSVYSWPVYNCITAQINICTLRAKQCFTLYMISRWTCVRRGRKAALKARPNVCCGWNGYGACDRTAVTALDRSYIVTSQVRVGGSILPSPPQPPPPRRRRSQNSKMAVWGGQRRGGAATPRALRSTVGERSVSGPSGGVSAATGHSPPLPGGTGLGGQLWPSHSGRQPWVTYHVSSCQVGSSQTRYLTTAKIGLGLIRPSTALF